MKPPRAVVVDANVVIAALLRAGDCRHVLLFGRLRFFAPAHLFDEVLEHLPEIVRRSGVPANVVRALLGDIRRRFEDVPRVTMTAVWARAEAAVHGTDPDDTAYVAAAMATGLPLWSLDKPLSKVKGIGHVTITQMTGKGRPPAP